MKLNFLDNTNRFSEGLEIISKDLGFEISDTGIPVIIEDGHDNIEIIYENGTGIIKFNRKIHFYRGISLFVEALQTKNEFIIIEEPQFVTNGPMFDVSRNAVLKVNGIKRMIEKMAIMGLDLIMLYTEDTYTVPQKPYFGYMRGKYSFEEIKMIDDYANIFGIEIVPCIQTLGHLTEALKWNYAKSMRDTKDILLAGSEDSYKFIDEMIRAASMPVRSKRIHIGMDEAHNLGLGQYLDQNGYRNRFEIMNEHLNKVVEITKKYGLEPMIWSDMFFRLGSKKRAYYDLDGFIPKEVKEKVPKEVKLVFWDYYHEDEKVYSEFLKRHNSFGTKPIFAGAIWTSAGMIVNYKKTFETMNAALNACKNQEVEEVIATMWGNDGAETNLFSALLGLQLFAEHGYSKKLDMDKFKRRFEFCTGGKYDDFMELSNMDILPSVNDDEYFPYDVNADCLLPSNPSKYLLWQDLLTGLFDKNIEGMDLNNYYKQLEKKMMEARSRNGEWDFIFNMVEKFCSVLSLKSLLGLQITEYYRAENKKELKHIVEIILPELQSRIKELWQAHREQWLLYYKPFGWEVMDVRYGGLMTRIETVKKTISDYLSGTTEKIIELEEEKLYFDGFINGENRKIGRCNEYTTIISASPFGWV